MGALKLMMENTKGPLHKEQAVPMVEHIVTRLDVLTDGDATCMERSAKPSDRQSGP